MKTLFCIKIVEFFRICTGKNSARYRVRAQDGLLLSNVSIADLSKIPAGTNLNTAYTVFIDLNGNNNPDTGEECTNVNIAAVAQWVKTAGSWWYRGGASHDNLAVPWRACLFELSL